MRRQPALCAAVVALCFVVRYVIRSTTFCSCLTVQCWLRARTTLLQPYTALCSSCARHEDRGADVWYLMFVPLQGKLDPGLSSGRAGARSNKGATSGPSEGSCAAEPTASAADAAWEQTMAASAAQRARGIDALRDLLQRGFQLELAQALCGTVPLRLHGTRAARRRSACSCTVDVERSHAAAVRALPPFTRPL
jgi:hypothetical protein